MSITSRRGMPRSRPRDRDARDEALEVPFERSRQRLVEVVGVEHEVALGRRVGAEVGEVGVAVELHREAGRRGGREVLGHDPGGSPEERER